MRHHEPNVVMVTPLVVCVAIAEDFPLGLESGAGNLQK